MIYLLDTDHNSLLQRGGTGAFALQNCLHTLAQDDYGTSIVSFEEQCKGWTDYINRVAVPETRVEGYARLHGTLRYYRKIAVWDYDGTADAVCAAMVKAKVRVSTKDLRIACIALARDATLLTRNTQDFARVPGLRFEDWSV